LVASVARREAALSGRLLHFNGVKSGDKHLHRRLNLATHLLHDAHMGRFDVGVVISNDSDLLEPIKIVRQELHKQVGVLNPHPNPSRALLPHIDFIKQIRAGVLAASQFSATLSDAHGTFTKPAGW
jgi:hypothetical protein